MQEESKSTETLYDYQKLRKYCEEIKGSFLGIVVEEPKNYVLILKSPYDMNKVRLTIESDTKPRPF